MRSHLLEGTVRHRRARPFTYELEHDVYYFALDLAELDEVDATAQAREPQPRERGVVPRHRPPGHAGRGPAGRRSSTISGSEGLDPAGWHDHPGHEPARPGLRVQPGQLLPVPRRTRHACGGRRRGAQHLRRATPVHAAAAPASDGPFVASMDKAFFVSPFIEMDARYTVHVRDDAAGLRIAIAERQGGEPLLSTSLVLRRVRLTDRNVVRMLLRHPLIGHRTIALIHWHALRLRLRGARFHPPPRARPRNRGRPMSRALDRHQVEVAPDRLVERTAERIMLAAARRIRVGRLVVVSPDGRRRVFGDPASEHVGEMRVHHRSAILRMLTGGDTGAGEAYMDGLWSSPDLPALLRVAALNREALALGTGWWRLPIRLQRTLVHRARRNTLGGQPAQHRSALRPRQRLLPAVPGRDHDVLERGLRQPGAGARRRQRNKYAVIAARAGLRRRAVLEIGSGWGGFALYAAGELGCHVTSITISPAQHRLATERVASRRAGGPRQGRAARLPRDRRHVRRDRLDRDARGRRRGLLLDLLRGVRSGARGRAGG